MALLGHPGKFTFCLAENEEASPFEPLHVARGFQPEDSVVTVVGAEAPHSIMYIGDADNPNNHIQLLDVLAIGLSNLATNNAIITGGNATIILNPEHAEILANALLDRKDIQQELVNRCVHDPEEVIRLAPGLAHRINADAPVTCFANPDQIIILVAGGSGLYSMAMPSWCAGPHKNSASSQLIEYGFFCEAPGLA